MFFLFSLLVASKNPIVLLPPLYGSSLYAYSNDTGLPFYCKKTYNGTKIWVNGAMLIPPALNCFLLTILNHPDENGIPKNKIELKPLTFGGNESVLEIIDVPLTKGFYQMYTKILGVFKDNGYVMNKDLFTAAYDFRNVPVFGGTFWDDLKKLIEKAYEDNHAKVDMFGYSQGGFTTQQFLTKHTTKEWRKKYINKVFLLAPSFTGASSVFYEFWTKEFSFAPFLKIEGVRKFMESWPTFHFHIPNFKIYENETYVYGPKGEEYKSHQVFDLLKEHEVIRGNNISKMFEHSLKIISQYPDEIDTNIPVTILYNSGINTSFALNFSKGWNKNPEKVFKQGDGTVSSFGLKSVCDKWKNTKCHDFDSHDESMTHDNLIFNNYVLNQIQNVIAGKPIEPKSEEQKKYVYDEQ